MTKTIIYATVQKKSMPDYLLTYELVEKVESHFTLILLVDKESYELLPKIPGPSLVGLK